MIHRPRDIAARIGGEEFGVLLPETDLNGAVKIAEQIRGLIAQCAIAHADSPVDRQVTVSIGVAAYRQESPSAFLQRADRALYAAKAAGRNQVFYDATATVDLTSVDQKPGV